MALAMDAGSSSSGKPGHRVGCKRGNFSRSRGSRDEPTSGTEECEAPANSVAPSPTASGCRMESVCAPPNPWTRAAARSPQLLCESLDLSTIDQCVSRYPPVTLDSLLLSLRWLCITPLLSVAVEVKVEASSARHPGVPSTFC